MREFGKLSAQQVARLQKPGRYGDGNGLYLQISKWNTRAWVLRYQLAGRSRDMGLGSLADVTLKEAREKARAARNMLVDGNDPIEARATKKMAARLEAASRITFRECADKYLAAHSAGWRNEKHAGQWRATLQAYAYPVIGNIAVSAIDTNHVIKILEPIWATKTPTASRVRGRVEAILDWAAARKFRSGENPARWRGHMDKLLPQRTKVSKVEHHPALAYLEVGAFIAELRKQESISAKALEFTILTAARTAEAINAHWDEFDLAAKLWIVPGSRMKAGREHRVPLSDRAVELLKALPREKGSPWVFPGGRAKRPLSNMAMLELLRGMKGDGLTVHGFRSTFRDWAGEETNYPREVAEAALGHVIGDKAEAAYRRGDALQKRRSLMDAWARYCALQRTGAPANVRAIRRA